MYTIKEFSAMTGLSKSKIRFYEQYGLFKNSRGDNNYRYYTEYDAFRLNSFRKFISLGFSVEESVALIDQVQNTEEFDALLASKRQYLEKLIESSQQKIELVDEIIRKKNLQEGSTFTVKEVCDYFYVRASDGNDFKISLRNKKEIERLEEIAEYSVNARIIPILDFLSEDEEIHPFYVAAIKTCNLDIIENLKEYTHLHRLNLGKVLEVVRHVNRKEGLKKSGFVEAMDYINKHGYSIRGDVMIIPSFLNLDDKGTDIETVIIPIK